MLSVISMLSVQKKKFIQEERIVKCEKAFKIFIIVFLGTLYLETIYCRNTNLFCGDLRIT